MTTVHAEVEGNEVADRMAKEAVAGELYGDSDSRRFQSRTSMAYLKRRATEAKTRGTKEWMRNCGKDKEAPILHSAEKNRVPQGR